MQPENLDPGRLCVGRNLGPAFGFGSRRLKLEINHKVGGQRTPRAQLAQLRKTEPAETAPAGVDHKQRVGGGVSICFDVANVRPRRASPAGNLPLREAASCSDGFEPTP